MFEQIHKLDPVRIPDVNSLLSFGGDSLEAKLVEICISHNEEVQSLLEHLIQITRTSGVFQQRTPLGRVIG